MYYTIYRLSDGKKLGASALRRNIPDPIPIGKGLATTEKPDRNQIWDAGTLTYIDRPAPRNITYSEYLLRLTPLERKAIYESTDAAVSTFLLAIDTERTLGKINLDGSVANWLTNLIVSAAIINTARKAEILG